MCVQVGIMVTAQRVPSVPSGLVFIQIQTELHWRAVPVQNAQTGVLLYLNFSAAVRANVSTRSLNSSPA